MFWTFHNSLIESVWTYSLSIIKITFGEAYETHCINIAGMKLQLEHIIMIAGTKLNRLFYWGISTPVGGFQMNGSLTCPGLGEVLVKVLTYVVCMPSRPSRPRQLWWYLYYWYLSGRAIFMLSWLQPLFSSIHCIHIISTWLIPDGSIHVQSKQMTNFLYHHSSLQHTGHLGPQG